eukprot:scaffold11725_cov116-Cylindrotheca_fusiformis.AAC.10
MDLERPSVFVVLATVCLRSYESPRRQVFQLAGHQINARPKDQHQYNTKPSCKCLVERALGGPHIKARNHLFSKKGLGQKFEMFAQLSTHYKVKPMKATRGRRQFVLFAESTLELL